MRAILPLLLLILASAASAREFRLCVDANEWAPYTYPDHDGLLQRRVRDAATHQGDSVSFVALPWLRCEAMVLSGSIDGVLALPGLASKREQFALPLSQGRVDEARAAGRGELVLVRRADSEIQWDGQHLAGLRGKVAYALGYDGIAARLDELGIPNSCDYRSDAQNVLALLAGRTNVIAIYAENAAALAEMAAYKDKVAILTPPLGHISFYLAFNKAFYALEQDRVERLWSGLSGLRDGD
jgi:polar amino acid transport system substrate-binding protein